jgi:hypothetical protein
VLNEFFRKWDVKWQGVFNVVCCVDGNHLLGSCALVDESGEFWQL